MIIAILFFVNCFVQNFSIVVFSIVAIMIIFSNMSTGFSVFVFCIPFCCIDMYVSLIMFGMCLVIFTLRAYIVMLFFDKKKISPIIIISVLIFIGYSLLPIFDYNMGLLIKLAVICFLMAFWYLFLNYKKELDIRLNVSIMAMSLLLSACFYLTYFVSPYMATKQIWNYNDSFIRFTCMFANPNPLAMVCEIGLSLLCYYIVSNKAQWNDYLCFVIFAIIGIFTLSKTFLILFGIMFIILLIYLIRSFRAKAFWIVLSVCIVVTIVSIFASDFLFTYFGRFFAFDNVDFTINDFLNILTTGRYDLWKGVIDYLFMNPFVLVFGRGLGAPLIESMSAHNFYISLVYEIGIIGSILFIGMFLVTYFVQKKKTGEKFNPAILIPILIIGMLMMVEDLFLFIY